MRAPSEQFLLKLSEKARISQDEILNMTRDPEGGETSLRKLIISTDLLSESDFAVVFSDYLGVPVVTEIGELPPDFVEEFTKLIPYRFANTHLFTPSRVAEDNIQFTIVDPVPMNIFADIASRMNTGFSLAVSTESVVLGAIQKNYGREDTTGQAAEAFNEDEEFRDLRELSIEDTEDLLSSEDEEPIKKVVNSILYQAAKAYASDIHIDPMQGFSLVRQRVDGVLREATRIPKHGHLPVVNRIKVMSGMDISIKNRPQDGRFVIRIGGRKVDIRVSILPTVYGERAVMRLLLQGHGLMKLDELGLSEKMLSRISEFTDYPNGIILVVGPTGSGKSTTLYAILQQFNSSLRNVITIEDPVEYNLSGLGQIQVNPKVGLTFASGLRSILRQDPDIIMVGEIRDEETAKIAIQASLTGHLVLSTLHTNDSPSTIVRLVEMGIEPYLVSSSIRAVLSQRLVRKICGNCVRKKKMPWEAFSKLGIPDYYKKYYKGYVFEGVGCEKCFQSGYKGRVGIYELMPLTEKLKRSLTDTSNANEIRKLALQNEMIPLVMDGFERILKGVTSFDEVLRVVMVEK